MALVCEYGSSPRRCSDPCLVEEGEPGANQVGTLSLNSLTPCAAAEHTCGSVSVPSDQSQLALGQAELWRSELRSERHEGAAIFVARMRHTVAGISEASTHRDSASCARWAADELPG